jgi:hypothetical protein
MHSCPKCGNTGVMHPDYDAPTLSYSGCAHRPGRHQVVNPIMQTTSAAAPTIATNHHLQPTSPAIKAANNDPNIPPIRTKDSVRACRWKGIRTRYVPQRR